MRLVGVLLLTIGLLAGCTGRGTPEASEEFCLAADRYDNELVRQQRRGEVDVDRQIARVEELARTAPASIEDDARLFLEALRRVRDDESVRGDPEVREAVDNVNRLANQACGVYDGGGF